MSTAAARPSLEKRVETEAVPHRLTDAREAPPVGLQLRIETPENVVLLRQLAGPAPRAVAYAIDFVVRLLIFAVLAIVFRIIGEVLPGMSAGVMLFALFLLQWAYYVVCEGCFNGRTVGKRMMGLRVIQEQGYPITFWGAVIRNLLRAGDLVLLFLPTVVCLLLTKNFQRLGDLVANTVVVSERSARLPSEPIIVERIAPLKRTEIGSYVPSRSTLTLIDEFLGRRGPSGIPPERGHEVAARLARVLAQKLDYKGDRKRLDSYPMAFLAEVYVTFARKEDEGTDVAVEVVPDEDDPFASRSEPSNPFENWQPDARRDRSRRSPL